MDIFDTVQAERYAQRDGLFIESRQLSWIVSFLLVVAFFIFWAGYRTGKSLSSQYAYSASQNEHDVTASEPIALSEHKNVADTTTITPGVTTLPDEKLYAQLALYATKAEADALVSSLRLINSIAYVKERVFLDETGEQHVWYQVVSDYFDNRADLEEYVALVAQQEQVHDVCFISC